MPRRHKILFFVLAVFTIVELVIIYFKVRNAHTLK